MKRYFLLVLLLCILVGVACATDWGASLGDWDFRKEITINNTGSNLTNYQLMFTVNRSAGTDSGFTVFLNGKCESDYDDIRFTTSDGGTLCDYWIESASSTVATIWVEAPSIVNSTAYGSTKFYLYYGNSGASAVSDGNATFPFFDHFDGDLTKWAGDTGYLSIASSIGTITATGTKWRKVSGNQAITSSGGAVRARADFYNDNFNLLMAANTSTTYDDSIYTGGVRESGYTYQQSTTKAGVKTQIAHTELDYGTYHIWDLCRIGTSKVRIFRDGVQCGADTTTNVPTADLYPAMAAYNNPVHLHVDWILIRNYVATEPTVSAWGSEEEPPCVGLSVTATIGGVSPPSGEGYAPLMVSFTDSSIGTNCTIDSWNWSFGDGYYSNSQNPQHYYLSSGTYAITLIVGNTSCAKYDGSCEDLGDECLLYAIDENTDIPIADFTVTELCGETTDTFYFIDFSTGGGLYAWNWSFGDGSYSELRNPTHQYSGNGDYTVSLTVSNAYGSDTETKTNYISVPCPATPTPTTPTPTTTPTSTYVSTGYISVDSKGIDFILWKLSDTNTTQIYVDGELQNISGIYYGQYGLLPNTPHTLCLNNGVCLTTNTNIDGFSVFWYWIVFIILIILVVISYKIPITYVPTLIYGIYLIGIYLPDISAGFNEYIIVGVLLIMGIIAAIQGVRK